MRARVERPGGARVGEAARFDQFVLEREGQHVGGTHLVHEPLVQLGDGGLVDEQHRQLGVALDALVAEHRLGEQLPPAGLHRHVGLLVADEDLEVAGLGQATPTPGERERRSRWGSVELVVGVHARPAYRRRSPPLPAGDDARS